MKTFLQSFCLVLAFLAGPVQAMQVTQVSDGFTAPMSLSFLPDGSFLVPEQKGVLWRVSLAGHKTEIRGLPVIDAQGQGGLLDVAVARDFDQSRTIFYSYTTALSGGIGTVLASAMIRSGYQSLEQHKILFEMSHGSETHLHFGGRIIEDASGHLYLTLGDLDQSENVQRLEHHSGKIIRINRDGSVPTDNPFSRHRQSLPEIWSLGLQNPEGIAFDLNGDLWVSQNGATGGDEINRIEKGANYGWPIIGFGLDDSGRKLGQGTHKRGMQQPDFYWDATIVPSGLLIYQADMFPEWQGDLFVGSLSLDFISRLSGDPLQEVDRIQTPETRRVRDVRQGLDGAIWFVSQDNGAVYRISN